MTWPPHDPAKSFEPRRRARVPPRGNGAAPPGILLWREIKGCLTTDTLVKRLIGSASLVVFAGPTGSGKTFVALDCCVHIAMEWPWFGRKVTRVGVLYVAAEGQTGLIKRIEAIKRHHNISDDVDVPFALYPEPIDLVTDGEGVKQIINYVQWLNEILPVRTGIVVIDTLARCFGSGDESATRDMNTFVTRCDTIRTTTEATVAVVHHFGKDESKGMRGSIALKAAADTVIEITGADGIRTARVEKQKDGAAGESFTFGLQPMDLEIDDDGDHVTSCVVVPSDVQAAGKRGKTKPPPAEYLKARDYLADTIATYGETKMIPTIPAGIRITTIDMWRECLERRGLYEPGDGGRQWFHRVRTRLITDNIIAMDGKHVWLVTKP